jgi:glucose/arabinose dehydrogenase
MPYRRHLITIIVVTLVGALITTLVPLTSTASKERSSTQTRSSGEEESRGKERTNAKQRSSNRKDAAEEVVSSGNERAGSLAPQRSRATALRLEPLATGLEQPLFVTGAGTGSDRLFVVEKPGRIQIVEAGRVLAPPFLDITDVVNDAAGERGLLGLAFHPDYESNDFFYVDYTDAEGDIVIARYTVSDDRNRADAESATPILEIPHRADARHNGGMLAFGPRDGYLYIAVGDGGAGQSANGQNTRTLLGKILRIDVDGTSGVGNYAIPESNPFADGDEGRPEIWAYGLRNPFRFSFDRKTGGLYIGDVGEAEWEEIDFGKPGQGGINYGWDIMEGRHCFRFPSNCDTTGLSQPIHEYSHEVGNVVTGGYVYRGEQIRALKGTYVFTDFGSREIWGLKRKRHGQWKRSVVLSNTEQWQIASFGESDAGELFAVDLVAGTLYQLTTA